ncbi:MAG: 2-amino-4-hydroxy-6-hydroxymethyldihydropteridine diphosphokinase [Chloroflexi bacterium]|nr:MAG: 2-amino-4-hydroxy-6-hydroxymethyldihydropteridine diphosphokinase [Chloroflexota bacterium]MBL1195723.1 2-amino-4-hydroxy-6-hydroxymethyldihydropteridine diphosphokinase [Chloroflexota bacterium]NOH13011.1 2-amino-4-hydroxy-6-hydroxymethyldihydropteridine diphosphokinase [Chloroflexota bacterium]
MHTVYVALGSNVGDRLQNLRDAIAQLAPEVKVTTESSIYETEPWGFEEQDDFLNMVVQGETDLEPDELLEHLKRIEDNVGRTKTFRNGPREIDLDILFYDDLILESDGLVIPHPRLHERAFVLVPLADIDTELVHPIWNHSVADLLQQLDVTEINKFDLNLND